MIVTLLGVLVLLCWCFNAYGLHRQMVSECWRSINILMKTSTIQKFQHADLNRDQESTTTVARSSDKSKPSSSPSSLCDSRTNEHAWRTLDFDYDPMAVVLSPLHRYLRLHCMRINWRFCKRAFLWRLCITMQSTIGIVFISKYGDAGSCT